jgi:hypothetical protein
MSDTGKGHPLEKNPNWKGGRTETSHGYVLVKRPEHPDSDTRGYVYEHRLVAEEKLGRRLGDDEQVHHKNGDRADNRPENLEVLSLQDHRARHREREDKRDPGEPNPAIECACGCEKKLRKFDGEGRPREYLQGHNGREQASPTQDEVLESLKNGEKKRAEIIKELDRTERAVASALEELLDKDEITRVKRGVYTRRGSGGVR